MNNDKNSFKYFLTEEEQKEQKEWEVIYSQMVFLKQDIEDSFKQLRSSLTEACELMRNKKEIEDA